MSIRRRRRRDVRSRQEKSSAPGKNGPGLHFFRCVPATQSGVRAFMDLRCVRALHTIEQRLLSFYHLMYRFPFSNLPAKGPGPRGSRQRVLAQWRGVDLAPVERARALRAESAADLMVGISK